MHVELAGYNVDSSILAQAAEGPVAVELFTPEPITAAYARISRSPKPVGEIRRIAREEIGRARRSNQVIIFETGHGAVSEHAVFNFDLVGVSRLAIEFIEGFRLGAGYTEKSQRYIQLDGDFVMPDELNPWKDQFRSLVDEQNTLYQRIFRTIRDRKLSELDTDPSRTQRRLIEGAAKEDARYATCLATEGQLGATYNARTLINLVRRAAFHPLAEVRELGRRLYEETDKVAPSLIMYADRDAYFANRDHELDLEFIAEGGCDLAMATNKLLDQIPPAQREEEIQQVTKIKAMTTTELVFASLLMRGSRGAIGLTQAQDVVKRSRTKQLIEFLQGSLAHHSEHHPLDREYEHQPEFSWEIILSAAAFGQLKRHRPMTLTSAPYDPKLGITVPEQIREVGLADDMQRICDASAELFYTISEKEPEAATYVLTNAHRRRVHVSANPREIDRIASLRMDHHAQWDIRKIVTEMVRQAREQDPLLFALTTGKDNSPERHRQFLERT